MKYKIIEQENYALIEIMEFQLNKNHDSNLIELLTDIRSKKKLKHVILNIKFAIHFNAFGLPMFFTVIIFLKNQVPLFYVKFP